MKTINKLKQIQADAMIMHIKLHNFHWNVKGLSFYHIHEMTEGMYLAMATLFDDTAERVLQLGQKPLVTMAQAVEYGHIEETEKTDFDAKEVLESIKLSKITNQWILVEETISYAKNGTYSLILKTLDGNSILKIENNNIQTWFETMNYAIPKWGIYRSLKHADQLKDEKVYFADFEINNLKIEK